MTAKTDSLDLNQLADAAREADVFERVDLQGETLICLARDCESDAEYYFEPDPARAGQRFLGLRTPDRWLSESIEAELVHVGDDLDELLEEELIEQGYEQSLEVDHFRDEEKRYTFRSRLPAGTTTPQATRVLLAYEACFRELGDMTAEEDEL